LLDASHYQSKDFTFFRKAAAEHMRSHPEAFRDFMVSEDGNPVTDGILFFCVPKKIISLNRCFILFYLLSSDLLQPSTRNIAQRWLRRQLGVASMRSV
jgi:hypothetical protein